MITSISTLWEINAGIFTLKETLNHCNVYIMMFIIYNNLEWHQHLFSQKQSTSWGPEYRLSLFLARFASSALAITLPDKWRWLLCNRCWMKYPINSQEQRERERGRERGGGGGWNVGGKQSEAVSSRVRWLSIPSLIGVTRHRGAAGLTSAITPTPRPPAINLTQRLPPTLPRLWAVDRDEALSRETGDVRS